MSTRPRNSSRIIAMVWMIRPLPTVSMTEREASSHRLVGNGHARWLLRARLHPYVRLEGPSLRPDLSSAGPARAAAVKDGRRPPRSGAPASLTGASTLARWARIGTEGDASGAGCGAVSGGAGAFVAVEGDEQRLRRAGGASRHPHRLSTRQPLRLSELRCQVPGLRYQRDDTSTSFSMKLTCRPAGPVPTVWRQAGLGAVGPRRQWLHAPVRHRRHGPHPAGPD